MFVLPELLNNKNPKTASPILSNKIKQLKIIVVSQRSYKFLLE